VKYFVLYKEKGAYNFSRSRKVFLKSIYSAHNKTLTCHCGEILIFIVHTICILYQYLPYLECKIRTCRYINNPDLSFFFWEIPSPSPSCFGRGVNFMHWHFVPWVWIDSILSPGVAHSPKKKVKALNLVRWHSSLITNIIHSQMHT
jgi:hypothetical protein